MLLYCYYMNSFSRWKTLSEECNADYVTHWHAVPLLFQDCADNAEKNVPKQTEEETLTWENIF